MLSLQISSSLRDVVTERRFQKDLTIETLKVKKTCFCNKQLFLYIVTKVSDIFLCVFRENWKSLQEGRHQ
jgi:hypothetical protein